MYCGVGCVCVQAFSSLAEAAYEALETQDGEQPETYCLSSYFEPIIQKLLETTDRSVTWASCDRPMYDRVIIDFASV